MQSMGFLAIIRMKITAKWLTSNPRRLTEIPTSFYTIRRMPEHGVLRGHPDETTAIEMADIKPEVTDV